MNKKVRPGMHADHLVVSFFFREHHTKYILWMKFGGGRGSKGEGRDERE